MKITLEPKELRELLKMLTPQVTVIDNGSPQLGQQSATAALPTVSEVQTSEKDYFATVSKFSEPSPADKAAAFEYDKPNGNGKEHQTFAEKLAAANDLIPPNGN